MRRNEEGSGSEDAAAQRGPGCCGASAQGGTSHLLLLPLFQSCNRLWTPTQGKTSQIRVRKCPALPPSSSPVPRALLLWQLYLGELQLSVPFIWAALSGWQVALVFKVRVVLPKFIFFPVTCGSSRRLAVGKFCGVPDSGSQ